MAAMCSPGLGLGLGLRRDETSLGERCGEPGRACRPGGLGAAFIRERCGGPAAVGWAGCSGVRAAAPLSRRKAGVAAVLRCLTGCLVRGPALAGDWYAASRAVAFHLKIKHNYCS